MIVMLLSPNFERYLHVEAKHSTHNLIHPNTFEKCEMSNIMELYKKSYMG